MIRTLYNLVIVALAASSTLGTTAVGQTVPTLRVAAGDRLLVGAAVMADQLDDPQHAAFVASQFNCLTGGNEFKPDALQNVRGVFTFQRADRIVAFAQRHDMKVVGHTLLWHNQSPVWMFQDASGKPLPRDQALANLKAHITEVVTHFKGKVTGWDVVNEAVSDRDDEYLRDTPARRAIGDDYVAAAFRFAREADPDGRWFYNDYNIELPGKRQRALRLVRELKAAGVQLDEVGIQGHWLLDAPTASVVRDAISAFAAEGVKVTISEMDVDVLPRTSAGADLSATEATGVDPYKQGLPPAVQRKLAERYAELFDVFAPFVRSGVLTRVTLWGTTDGDSWLNDFPVKGRTNHPLPFDRERRPKPAFDAVVGALKSLGDDPRADR